MSKSMSTSWDYDVECLYDEDGTEAAIRPDGMSDEAWDWVAGRIVLSMNNLLQIEAKLRQ